MPRSRVLSFMSQWGGGPPRSPTEESARLKPAFSDTSLQNNGSRATHNDRESILPMGTSQKLDANGPNSPGSHQQNVSKSRGDSKSMRPLSMMQTYAPPQVEVARDTPPELQPIFTYLNSHSNKLYQEGYFLKLHDLDSRGRPSPDRTWVECFAQLIGTVLSLWDASALDQAGEDGEVVPTFINLSDASIKMIESLPMNGVHGGTLQNVLSISTAANNRYLLHFNSLNSLTQWTAGIRLAMFEHATLQEAYTGSLIAGKGRFLNNIKAIMDRSKFAHEDWARVRFGAGTPWRRCWCVISPPPEKEFAKAQKSLKKTSAYDRIKLPKGEIKFYDTRKVTKKTQPVATVTDAYAAYAIYPQAKPLIDQSTLVKLEGLVTLHSSMQGTTEGFIFVMPEVHPAVTGFEMMLRWLFPVYDVFGLYGRPTRLVSDSLDQRGLMFAMPKERRYGYLDILDVSGLIHTKGSNAWSERQWRREMKKLTAERMMNQMDSPRVSQQFNERRATSNVRFGEPGNAHSSPGSRSASPSKYPDVEVHSSRPSRVDSAPPGQMFSSPHKRSASDAVGYRKQRNEVPSRLSYDQMRPDDIDEEYAPEPPRHTGALANFSRRPVPSALQRIQSETEVPTVDSSNSPYMVPPAPVGTPPMMTHQPNSRPPTQPYQAPELRRAYSNVDEATLSEMKEAVHPMDDESMGNGEAWTGEVQYRQQNTVASTSASRERGASADPSQGVVPTALLKDPRQRLSTIPGSPFAGTRAENYVSSPNQASMPQLDGGADHPSVESTANASATRQPLHSSASVMRKPVPQSFAVNTMATNNSTQDPPSPSSPINTEGLEGDVIDEAALERVLNQERHGTMRSAATQSTEPDYASTASVSGGAERPSIEKPRAGKLKTVGETDMASTNQVSVGAGRLDTWGADQAALTSEIPKFDFGPTYTYKPTSRPGTQGTLTPGDMTASTRRSRSADDRPRSSSQDRLSAYLGGSARSSPHESKRNSYFAGRHTPSPSGGMTPTGLDEPGNRNSIAWQPAGANDSAVSGRNVTPEAWVQHRAQMAQQTPQYALPSKAAPNFAHERNTSRDGVRPSRKLTKTPPLSRTLSADWTNPTGRQTPPSRPQSRGAGATLDPRTLSAREQMHISRATGTPLVNLPSRPVRQSNDQPGLVGYVSTRERERASNRNSTVVQQAIAERQQQQQMRMESEYYQQNPHASFYPPAQYYPPNQQDQYYQPAPAPTRPSPYHQHSWSASTSYAQQQQQQTPRTFASPSMHAPSSSYGAPLPAPPGGYYAPSPTAASPTQGPPQQDAHRQAYGASFYRQGGGRR